MASRNRLSLYDRAPREIWMMNGALTVGFVGSLLESDLPKLPRNRPTVCSRLLMLYAPTAYLPYACANNCLVVTIMPFAFSFDP